MTEITHIHARQILDARGQPALEVVVHLGTRGQGRVAVPGAPQRGAAAAREHRDDEPAWFGGPGLHRAVVAVNTIVAPALVGWEAEDQAAIDQLLLALNDPPDKARLGLNITLGVSLAVAHAASAARRVPLYRHLRELVGTLGRTLPVPLLTMIRSGPPAARSPDFQQWMIVPLGAESFTAALGWAAQIYQVLRQILEERAWPTAVGDSGGFAPLLRSTAAAELILQAIERAGYQPGEQVALALAVAASRFYDPATGYRPAGADPPLTSDELIARYADWVARYPLISLEDGLAAEDWAGWQRLHTRLGPQLQLVGGDIFAADPARIRRGIRAGCANAVRITPGECATLTETLAAIALARSVAWATVAARHTSETEDTTIADLAVALDMGQIQAGAPAHGEQVAKYNQLLRIEAELGAGHYAGRAAFRRNPEPLLP